nr:hypothetical protein [Tanacetum cinerariifolium]
MLQDVKSYLGRCFAMKDLGEAAYILGIMIYRDRSKRLIGLCQSAYIKKILERFYMENFKRESIPMQEKLQQQQHTQSRRSRILIAIAAFYDYEIWQMDVKTAFLNEEVYMEQPEGFVSQKYPNRNPRDAHWTAVKNILKYLRNTKDMFPVYESDMKRELRVSCYTDAGYLTDADDMKSQTRYVFILNGCDVDWKSTKQSIFATLSTDVEYIVAFDASKEAVWIRKFIFGLGVVPTIEEPINMYCDNTRAIAIVKNHGVTKGARHFRAKVNYLRETIEMGDVRIEKVDTYYNLADPFTKALAFPKHSEFTEKIGMIPASNLIWCLQGPLIRFLTPRDIAREGFTLQSCVAGLIVNGTWNWPNTWLAKAPTLGTIVAPILYDHNDTVCWRDSSGSLSNFSVRSAWEAFRPRGMESVPPILDEIIDWFPPMAAKRTVKSIFGKLLFAATAYYIWSERNMWLFRNSRRSPEELKDLIMVVVRLKISTFRFKNKLEVIRMLSAWKLPKTQEEGQSVSSYVLKMKGYIDNLERLGHPVTLVLGVSLILIGLRKEFNGFVQNYNMHSLKKTINELHAMLKLHEQTLPENNAPALHVIRAGHWKRNCPRYLVELLKMKKNAASGAGGSEAPALLAGQIESLTPVASHEHEGFPDFVGYLAP